MSSTPLSAPGITPARNVVAAVLVMGVLATSGCSSLRVQSLPAPTANFSDRYTFQIVEAPAEEDTVVRVRSAEPMLNNSIIDQVVRDQIQLAFEIRGYRMTKDDPDFTVAYYTRARERLDVSSLNDCGYPYRYGYGYGSGCYITEFTEGTVIVDVVDPKTDRLIWRGSGVARVSDNPNKYLEQLGKAITAIVQRFPPVMPATAVASGNRRK